jgi:hypothetical protein
MFWCIAIHREFTQVLLKRTAIKQFSIIMHIKCAGFGLNLQIV